MPAGVVDALEDDLNTPLAVSYLHEMARDLNVETDPARRARFKANLLHGAHLLGLLNSDTETWFKKPRSYGYSGQGGFKFGGAAETVFAPAVSEDEINALIEARLAARKAKNFKEADRIRDDLKSKGVILEDGPKGTTWKRAG
jgi:cysteinyl-tRNA synthetase